MNLNFLICAGMDWAQSRRQWEPWGWVLGVLQPSSECITRWSLEQGQPALCSPHQVQELHILMDTWYQQGGK